MIARSTRPRLAVAWQAHDEAWHRVKVAFIAAALIVAVVAVVLATSAVWGAEPVAFAPNRPPVAAQYPTVILTGPTEVRTGSCSLYFTAGTTAKNLTWQVEPDDGTATILELPLFRGMAPDGTPKVESAAGITFSKPGKYLLIVAGGLGDYPGIATKWITVTGDGPNPDPDPIPPVPGKRFVLVLEETGTRTAKQAQTIEGLRAYLTTKRHSYRVLDQDAVGPDGKQPAWLVAYKAALAKAGVSIPCLIVGDSLAGGKVYAAVALPATKEAAVKVVQDAGG